MRRKTTCKSLNTSYLISYKKKNQFVGETEQALNEQMNSHRSDFANLNLLGHSVDDIQVVVIEQLWQKDTPLKKIIYFCSGSSPVFLRLWSCISSPSHSNETGRSVSKHFPVLSSDIR